MRFRRVAASVGASVLVVAGLALAGASPASADQVWHQSQGRPSADAECPTSTAADLAAGWSAWNKSYEMWMNGGKGGWTCTRSITWAKDKVVGHPSAGCVQFYDDPTFPFYVDFLGGWSLPNRSLGYEPGCRIVIGNTARLNLVYAPRGFSPLDLCREAFPDLAVTLSNYGYDAWSCGESPPL